MNVNKPDGVQEVEIPQEKLDKFERGEIAMSEFNEGERAFLDRLMRGEVSDGEAPAEEAVKEVAEVVPQEDAKPPKGFVDGLKYKEKADEANSFKQKADSFAKQLEETRLALEAIKAQQSVVVPNPIKDKDQVWTEGHQEDIATRVARLEAQRMEGVRGSQEKLEKLEKQLAEQARFAEINAFASSYPELKLGRPFEEANAEYIQFTQKLGATPQDMSLVDKFFADAAFRKDAEARGIKPPKDFEKLNPILEVFHRKSKLNYPNLDDAYLGYLRETNQLEKRFNSKYLKGVEDAINKVSSNKNETATLDPSSSNEPASAMSEPQMMAWIAANSRLVTPSQKATMAQIQAYLKAQANG